MVTTSKIISELITIAQTHLNSLDPNLGIFGIEHKNLHACRLTKSWITKCMEVIMHDNHAMEQ